MCIFPDHAREADVIRLNLRHVQRQRVRGGVDGLY